MKRINGLFEKICSRENIELAYKKAIQGKKHYRDVVEFNKNKDKNLDKLCAEMQNLTYRTSKYFVFTLFSGGKNRIIYKLPIRDRIAQHAIMIYLEPIFRSSFITDTYSSIKERGIHMGCKRVEAALKDRKNTKYCLKLDIHKFYPSINTDLLKERLKSKFKDKKLLQLLFEIVDSTNGNGVPIGNYTSQYFANFFLTPMDHWIKEELRVKYYFRYCDDIVILGPSKEYLWNIFYRVKEYLTKYKLEIKPNYQVFPVESRSIDFLGYRFRHEFTLIRKKTKQNFINKLNKAQIAGDETQRMKILGSYWGMFCHANCHNLWKKYTGVNRFSDLGIDVKTKVHVKSILDKDIDVYSIKILNKRLKGQDKKYVRVEAALNGRVIRFDSFAEMILDAAEQIKQSDLPFTTRIIDNDGFYQFE